MKTLRIAEGLSLPLETVTQAVAIVAKRRAGKSYLARRVAEQMFKADLQVVIVDPKGDWHGIRSAADGKAPGLPVIILGGERGDVPLEVSGGEVVAKLVVEECASVLLDLSLFRKHEVATFMTAFLENIYRLKAREIYRTPKGRAAARESEIQTVDDLHRHVFSNLLTAPQRAILRVLIDAYPEAMPADEVGRRAGLEASGGYWRANVGRLRSLQLVSKKGPLQALPVLFLEGR